MNKFFKVCCIVTLGTVFFGTYKLMNPDQFKDLIECKNVADLQQHKLDISPIKIDGSAEIWSVKSDSKLPCFELTFRNEGKRSFKNNSVLLSTVCNTITEGAGNYDDVELKKVLEDHSIDISIYATGDDMVVRCSCLEKYFDLAVDLVKDMLTKAHLKSEKIEFSKQAYVTSVQQSMFLPQPLAEEKLNNLMYPEGHPYRYSIKDGLKRAKAITKADVDGVYKKLFNPKDLSITIVSNLDAQKIKETFESLVNNLKESKVDKTFNSVTQTADLAQKGVRQHVELDTPQSAVLFALPGAKRNSPEFFATAIATDVLGDAGIIARLAISVRDKAGLVYRIGTYTVDSDMQAFIKGYADTRPENVDKVISIVREEFKKIYDNGITERELNLFKVRRYAKSIFDSNMSILNFVSDLRSENVAIDAVNTYLENIKKLTLAEVNAVVKKIFNPENLIFVDCGKAQKEENK